MIMENLKALVTGGSSGIGLAIARGFADAGMEVMAADRRPFLEAGEDVYFHLTDVCNGNDVAALHEDYSRRLGVPDVLVCNAGQGIHQPISEGNPDQWEQVIATNLTGTLRILRAFLPGMIGRGSGDVVFISSVSARAAYPGGGVYSATKAALEQLAETLRLEVQPGIRVTTIAPGVVDTAFFQNMIDGGQTPESIGWGAVTPGEIADTVLYAVTRPRRIAINHLTVRPAAQPL